jgi:hypothetical protein
LVAEFLEMMDQP